MTNYCEDYPCCGHTDGLGCDWTYTEAARAHDLAHAFCEHEHGWCRDLPYEDEEEPNCSGATTSTQDGIEFCDNCDRPTTEH